MFMQQHLLFKTFACIEKLNLRRDRKIYFLIKKTYPKTFWGAFFINDSNYKEKNLKQRLNCLQKKQIFATNMYKQEK